jgi:transcriptional regulator with XRE-family HTH domain
MSELLHEYAAPDVICARLRTARVVRGLSQQQLAAVAEIEQQQVSRMERSEHSSLRLTDFLSVCSALSVSASSLLSPEESGYLEEISPRDQLKSMVDIAKADLIIGRLPSGRRCILKNRYGLVDGAVDQEIKLAQLRGDEVVFVEKDRLF